MSIETRASEELYDVVVNREGQYSIWMVEKSLPAGWDKIGFQGAKDACLAHIKEVWVDMRPRSLRDVTGRAE